MPADLVDELEVRRVLKRACDAVCGPETFALQSRESKYIIDLVCEGKRPPSDRILKALGYEKVTRYRNVRTSVNPNPPADIGSIVPRNI